MKNLEREQFQGCVFLIIYKNIPKYNLLTDIKYNIY